jgi:hypothetical protein
METPRNSHVAPYLIVGVALLLAACRHPAAESAPRIDMKRLQSSFSTFEGKRIVLHACAYHDAHGVVVVDCDHSGARKSRVMFMIVQKDNATAIAQYRSLFKVFGPAYSADLTGVPNLGDKGAVLIFEFESAADIYEVPGCSLWPTSAACNP